jgi:hypothetical protein
MTVNLPFSTLAVVAGDPIFVPSELTEVEFESARLDVERSLNATTERAYDLAKSGKSRRIQPGANATPQQFRQ